MPRLQFLAVLGERARRGKVLDVSSASASWRWSSATRSRGLRLEQDRAEAAVSAFLVQVRGARFGLDLLRIELLKLQDEAHGRLKANHRDERAWEISES